MRNITSRKVAWYDLRNLFFVWSLALALFASGAAPSFSQGTGQKWAASWATAIQSAYALPTSPQAAFVSAYDPQPDLSFAIPNSTASNQTFRMIIKPDLWGQTIRVKFSNFFGTQPISFSSATIGLQSYQANVAPGTISPMTFNGQKTAIIPPGGFIFSDAVQLSFVNSNTLALLRGRNLAVSFAVSGTSGPLSVHSTAFTTSYISAPNSADATQQTSEYFFPYSTTSFFLVSEVDVLAPSNTVVVCAFGDSITDGTFSTLNGDDRWPNVMSNVLHERFGDRVSVVNEGIGGNAVTLTVTGQPAVINGFGQVAAAIHNSGVLLIGGTITPSATPNNVTPGNSPLAVLGGAALAQGYGSARTDQIRLAINRFILTPNTGVFQDVADFAAATRDPSTGSLYANFVPNSEGSAGDYLHPNRAGYVNMGFVAADAVARVGKLQIGQ